MISTPVALSIGVGLVLLLWAVILSGAYGDPVNEFDQRPQIRAVFLLTLGITGTLTIWLAVLTVIVWAKLAS